MGRKAQNSGPAVPVAALLAHACTLLTHLDSARLDAEILLATAIGKRRSWLHAWPDAPIARAQMQTFLRAVRQRAAGKPLAYLTGRREFWSLELEVTPATLVPRVETETLVDIALGVTGDTDTVLDLGTGSGAVALAIATERPAARVVGTDICRQALAVARGNARRLRLEVEWLHTSWLAGIAADCVDVIVSNPPYVADDDPHLDGDGVRAEPRLALVAGRSGLDAIVEIVTAARGRLRDNGWLALEHGADQAHRVRELLRSNGFHAIATYEDTHGCDRVTIARRGAG